MATNQEDKANSSLESDGSGVYSGDDESDDEQATFYQKQNDMQLKLIQNLKSTLQTSKSRADKAESEKDLWKDQLQALTPKH